MNRNGKRDIIQIEEAYEAVVGNRWWVVLQRDVELALITR